MSRNSKNHKRVVAEKAASEQRLKGNKGGRTKCQHGKKKAWWQVSPYTYAAFIKGKKNAKPEGTT